MDANRIFDTSFNVIKSIIKDRISFNSAIKNQIKNIRKDELNLISNLSGLFLRNYFSIRYITEASFNSSQLEVVIYSGLVFVNIYFKKGVDEKTAITYLANKLELFQIKYDEETKAKFKKFLENKNDSLKEYLDTKFKGKSFRKYLSALTNLPERIIKMIQNQYDRKIGFDTIHSIFRMPSQYAIGNILLADNLTDQMKSNFHIIEPNFYEYDQKTSIRKEEAIRTGLLLPIQKAEYNLVKSLPNLLGSNITFYFEEKSSIYYTLINKYLNEGNKLSLACNKPSLNQDLYSKIKPLGINKLDIYESTHSELIAHLSEKQDLFILLPENSNFEQLRRVPEYGILFDTSKLDSIIENEFLKLSDSTQYIADDGLLVYVVPTLNIKETMIITNKFLNAHKEFSKVKEETFFPFEKDNSILYYAIFQKKVSK